MAEAMLFGAVIDGLMFDLDGNTGGISCRRSIGNDH